MSELFLSAVDCLGCWHLSLDEKELVIPIKLFVKKE